MSLLLYARFGQGWLLFVLLLLVPDLSMLGYTKDVRVGAATYNLFHSYAAPLLLAAAGVLAPHPLAVAVALIWTAHIGVDRMLGYGLKQATGFKDTHLGRIGA